MALRISEETEGQYKIFLHFIFFMNPINYYGQIIFQPSQLLLPNSFIQFWGDVLHKVDVKSTLIV